MNGSFSTTDLGQAAFLMSLRYPFIGAELAGRSRVEFKFMNHSNGAFASEAAMEFANNCQAPAKPLLDSFRFLKSVLKDVRTQTIVNSGEVNGINQRNQGA